ncbi:hypothetical protein OGAPHI_007395 [Ogataea philodendri]|uniref:Uncharacterized protein n=1 Tax=Ogataea philodendri TaxID=1378263 RepID=A0A9P8NVA6_9ASCO|nr:uncharacterized protein OGAPHI_007395 [Ogataea philodendri]KAH3660190.1 hypothetical protein OGAPHI_007395 [Ogataea philodendri]
MDVDHVIPLLLRHLGKRAVSENTCVIDEDVHGSKRVDSRLHNLVRPAPAPVTMTTLSLSDVILVLPWSLAGSLDDCSMMRLAPSLRSQRICANRPAATSKIEPEQSQSTELRYKTSGATFSGSSLCNTSGGITVSVILDLASGAIAFTLMLYFAPSLASVSARPTKPSLAADLNAPLRCTSKTAWKSFSDMFLNDESFKIPALLINTCTLPNVSTAVFTIPSGLVTTLS